MRLSAFILFLLGVGLITFGAWVLQTPTLTPQESRSVMIVFFGSGYLLAYVGLWVWIRLTILGWLIRFASHNWHEGMKEE